MTELVVVDDEDVLIIEGAVDLHVVVWEAEAMFVALGEPGRSGGLAGGTAGQLRAKATDADFDEEWIDPPESLPPGGDENDVLTKASSASGDAEWRPPTATGATAADIATVMAFSARHG